VKSTDTAYFGPPSGPERPSLPACAEGAPWAPESIAYFGAAVAGGVSEFQVSRIISHFPSFR
jgi:hypothetical protein